MIQLRSVLNVVDGSGVLKVRCIGLSGTGRTGQVGTSCLAAVRSVLPGTGWKRGQKVRALVVRTRKPVVNPSGIRVGFFENRVILLSEKGTPIGTRIKGPLPSILRLKGFAKVFALGARPI